MHRSVMHRSVMHMSVCDACRDQEQLSEPTSTHTVAASS